MNEKLEKTVQKTIEALARIQRFIIKYKSNLSAEQIRIMSDNISELQKIVSKLK